MGLVKKAKETVSSLDSLVKEDVKPLINGDVKEITGKIDALLGNEIKEALAKANKLLDKDIPSLIRCLKLGIIIVAISAALVSVAACVKFFL
ncbi:MAG: hypothetical protein J5817_00105 [Treponema sp.]|nr:hypothetical protein [Treponema sp.]